MFDFCYTKRNLPFERHDNCPGKFQKWYVGPVGRGRNKNPNGIIYLDEWTTCSCLCHIPEEDRPKTTKKTKTRKSRRKS